MNRNVAVCIVYATLCAAVVGLNVVACASAQPAAKSAECAAIRAFYDRAQTELIDRGACDTAPSASSCVPHIALREAFIASLQENKCPSAAK